MLTPDANNIDPKAEAIINNELKLVKGRIEDLLLTAGYEEVLRQICQPQAKGGDFFGGGGGIKVIANDYEEPDGVCAPLLVAFPMDRHRPHHPIIHVLEFMHVAHSIDHYLHRCYPTTRVVAFFCDVWAGSFFDDVWARELQRWCRRSPPVLFKFFLVPSNRPGTKLTEINFNPA